MDDWLVATHICFIFIPDPWGNDFQFDGGIFFKVGWWTNHQPEDETSTVEYNNLNWLSTHESFRVSDLPLNFGRLGFSSTKVRMQFRDTVRVFFAKDFSF